MKRIIRKASTDDLPRIQELIEAGRQKMRAEGNMEQWADGSPQPEIFMQDITDGNSYLVEEGNRAVATFAFVKGPDITYNKIFDGAWLNDKPYYVIHRIASEPGVHGVLKDVLAWSESYTDTLRIDTHRKNKSMRSALEKYGFRYCGIIYLLDGAERLAFQR
ncbi:MAG: N-acetyltransferase [Prevotella sp.]|nr:N-acetyltransferase [Prevotella sp.]